MQGKDAKDGRSTGPKGITTKQIAHSLRANMGIIADAARALDVSRPNLSKRIHGDARLLRLLQHGIKEDVKDIAESQLLKKIKAGDVRAITYYLDRQAKDRGYTVRTEITGADGAPIQPAESTTKLVIDGETLELIRSRYFDDSDDA